MPLYLVACYNKIRFFITTRLKKERKKGGYASPCVSGVEIILCNNAKRNLYDTQSIKREEKRDMRPTHREGYTQCEPTHFSSV